MRVAMNLRNLDIIMLAKFIMLLMIFGIFTIDNRAVLNISSILMVVISIYHIVKNKINVLSLAKEFCRNRKILLIFNVWCLGCIAFFTYKDNAISALNIFFKDWRYPLVFLLFFLAFHYHKETLKKTYVFSVIATLAYVILVVPILRIIKNNPQELYLQLRYGFAFYVVMLYPFMLTSAVLLKGRYLKAFLFLMSFLSFLFMLYTGARAGILALVIETIVLMFFCVKNIKLLLIGMLCFISVGISGITIMYNVFPQVKYKVNQSLKIDNISRFTSGRDLIVSQRYPLIMNSTKNIIFGIGYGNSTYNQYLVDHHAPKKGGVFNPKHGSYNLDDPVFFIILYNVGFGGLILFITSMIVNIKDMTSSIKINKDIFNISILSSFIGYFLVYCLFEKMYMDIYLLYSVLILLFSSNKFLSKNK